MAKTTIVMEKSTTHASAHLAKSEYAAATLEPVKKESKPVRLGPRGVLVSEALSLWLRPVMVLMMIVMDKSMISLLIVMSAILPMRGLVSATRGRGVAPMVCGQLVLEVDSPLSIYATGKTTIAMEKSMRRSAA
tara:strand:- start:6856 stop:7257 length:402 start_codon:yes stop_codon:yes gene_type:complete